jgi:hypothetical protein
MKTLPVPPAWQGALLEATPPSDMALFQLPTGSYVTRASFAFTRGSFRDKRRFAATAVLVTHPEGDFLIDAGFAPTSRLTSTRSRGTHALLIRQPAPPASNSTPAATTAAGCAAF